MAKDRSRDVSNSAERTMQISKTGEQSVMETSQQMDKIKEQMELITESIMSLSEQSQSIGEIMTTINDLAEQSNLLAVNASIEAAKAGEFGKGFTVVANEVRSLAEQSKQATLQVREILNDIQKATSTTVMATEQGSKTIEKGVIQAKEAGSTINELTDVIREASEAAILIGTSSQQQFTGIDQVTIAVKSIEDASNQNLEGAKQLDIAAERLVKLGNDLKSLIEQYRI